MAYGTRTVNIGTDWTKITNKVALLQFNNAMLMVLTGGTTPTDEAGFVMEVNEKYINNSTSITVWGKTQNHMNMTGINSVRVAEDLA